MGSLMVKARISWRLAALPSSAWMGSSLDDARPGRRRAWLHAAAGPLPASFSGPFSASVAAAPAHALPKALQILRVVAELGRLRPRGDGHRRAAL
eukprot:4890868-Pyramimonas_sp.AAC.1